MKDISFKQLRAVIAIAKAGKINAAADALGLTPSAVTQQLKLLEDTIGFSLFDRTRDGLLLTGAGQRLLETAHRVETALDDCDALLRSMRDLDGGNVSVGVVSTAKYFAPRLIAAFLKVHPRIELHLSVRNRQDTVNALRDYEIDIAIMGRPPSEVATEHAPFGTHPHVMIASPDHPLLGYRALRKEDLSGEQFLMREEGSGTRKLTEDFFAGVPITRSNMRIDIGSNETIKQAVIAGLGLAIISAHTIEAELHSGRLRLLDVEGLPIQRNWYGVRHAEKRLMPGAMAFWFFLKTEGSRFLPCF